MLTKSVNGAEDQLLIFGMGKKPKAEGFTQVIFRGQGEWQRPWDSMVSLAQEFKWDSWLCLPDLSHHKGRGWQLETLVGAPGSRGNVKAGVLRTSDAEAVSDQDTAGHEVKWASRQ